MTAGELACVCIIFAAWLGLAATVHDFALSLFFLFVSGFSGTMAISRHEATQRKRELRGRR